MLWTRKTPPRKKSQPVSPQSEWLKAAPRLADGTMVPWIALAPHQVRALVLCPTSCYESTRTEESLWLHDRGVLAVPFHTTDPIGLAQALTFLAEHVGRGSRNPIRVLAVGQVCLNAIQNCGLVADDLLPLSSQMDAVRDRLDRFGGGL